MSLRASFDRLCGYRVLERDGVYLRWKGFDPEFGARFEREVLSHPNPSDVNLMLNTAGITVCVNCLRGHHHLCAIRVTSPPRPRCGCVANAHAYDPPPVEVS